MITRLTFASLPTSSLWIKRRDPTEPHQPAAGLRYVDFVPTQPDEPGKFVRLEQLVERANAWCRAGRPNASQIVTVETLYVPASGDWTVDTELTLRTFPGRYVAILRVFYAPDESPAAGHLQSALAQCGMHFELGVLDFLPKHVSGGGLFRRPQFEPLSTCIARAGDWIRAQSRKDARSSERRLATLDEPVRGLLAAQRAFEFKNAQCLEVWMRGLHHVDSGQMHCASDRGDYLRMFRVCYVRLVRDGGTSADAGAAGKTSRAADRGRSGKARKTPRLVAAEESETVDTEAESDDDALVGVDKLGAADMDGGHLQTIHLSSVIFTPADAEATVAEIKRKMHSWVENCCKGWFPVFRHFFLLN